MHCVALAGANELPSRDALAAAEVHQHEACGPLEAATMHGLRRRARCPAQLGSMCASNADGESDRIAYQLVSVEIGRKDYTAPGRACHNVRLPEYCKILLLYPRPRARPPPKRVSEGFHVSSIAPPTVTQPDTSTAPAAHGKLAQCAPTLSEEHPVYFALCRISSQAYYR